jgi:hypothetical protein
VTDHAEAAALLLEAVAAKLRAGFSPEDLGREVALIGRMMERKTLVIHRLNALLCIALQPARDKT